METVPSLCLDFADAPSADMTFHRARASCTCTTTAPSSGSAVASAAKTASTWDETLANSAGQNTTAKKRKEEPNTNLIILGAPGAGKGTYASRLSSILSIRSVATGDMFREEIKRNTSLGKKVAQYVNSGELVPDDIVIDILKKRIAEPSSIKGFILDGFPRTVQQAQALEKITKIDAIIRVIVPEWIIIERLSNRRICSNCGTIYNLRYLKPKVEGVCDKCGGKLYQRQDDKPEVVKERLKVYEKQTQPLIEYYQQKTSMLEVENDQIDAPPEKIIEKIMAKLKKPNL